jgi:hypothetical protein
MSENEEKRTTIIEDAPIKLSKFLVFGKVIAESRRKIGRMTSDLSQEQENSIFAFKLREVIS